MIGVSACRRHSNLYPTTDALFKHSLEACVNAACPSRTRSLAVCLPGRKPYDRQLEQAGMGDMQRLRQLRWAVLGARTNRKGDRRSCQLKPRRIAYAATVSPARDARSCPLACAQGRAPRPDTTGCHHADQTQDCASPRQTSASRRVLQAAHSLPHSAAPPAPRLPRAAGCSRPAARTAPHPGTPRPACPAAPPRHGLHPRCWPPHQTLRRLRAQRCPPPPQRTPHLLKHVWALTHRAQTPIA